MFKSESWQFERKVHLVMGALMGRCGLVAPGMAGRKEEEKKHRRVMGGTVSLCDIQMLKS